MSRSVLTATQPKMVLQSYLDDLLQEALLDLESEVPPLAPAPVVSPAAPVVVAPVVMPVLEIEVPVTLPAPAPAIVALEKSLSVPVIASPCVPDATVPMVDPVPQATREMPASPVEALIPDWAGASFECLLFNVAGLTLAVPLVSLGSIYPLDAEELTPLFGQPDWFLGILPGPAGNLKVLDTARWLIPDRYRDDFREGLKYAISIQGYDWGLAVHQVNRSIRLHPDEVKWRTQRSQRPWLAGTVIEHMCALLDITALAELIASGATRHKDFLSGN